MHLPIDEGLPPSIFAEDQARHLRLTLAVQSVVCLLRIVAMLDIVGGFFMALTLALGWYAHKANMNITIITVWGIMNALHSVLDGLLGVFSVALRLISFQFDNLLLCFAVPLVELAGAYVAWQLIMHHDARGGDVAHISQAHLIGYGTAEPKKPSKSGQEDLIDKAADRIASLARCDMIKKKQPDPFLTA